MALTINRTVVTEFPLPEKVYSTMDIARQAVRIEETLELSEYLVLHRYVKNRNGVVTTLPTINEVFETLLASPNTKVEVKYTSLTELGEP